jgi:hypothetical protein
MADPQEDEVMLPGGTWTFNKPTTIAGRAVDSGTDTGFRAYQQLLYFYTEGDSANPCKINGCVGLKDLYFRSNENGSNVQTTQDFQTVNPTVLVDVNVTELTGVALNKLVYIDGAGYYRVISIDGTLLSLRNEGFNGNAGAGVTITAGTTVYPDNAVFYMSDGNSIEFTLDNTDFHFGNYRFGTFHVDRADDWGSLSVYLTNGAATRWYAWRVDGSVVFTTDGSGCWIGSSAFFGEGYVATYPMAGCQIRTYQPVINQWDQYQPYIPYLPDSPNDWPDGPPAAYHEALDQLARRFFRPSLAQVTLSAPQITNLATNDAVQFDTFLASTNDGFFNWINLQPNGQVQLWFGDNLNRGRSSFKLVGNLGSLYDGAIAIQWWDVTNNRGVGNVTGNVGSGVPGDAVAIIPFEYNTPLNTYTVFQLRMVFTVGVTHIGENTSGGFILPTATVEQLGSPRL